MYFQGRKPIVEEVGPFVYKAVTVKDSVDHGTAKINLKYEDDGDTLTYRPRYYESGCCWFCLT